MAAQFIPSLGSTATGLRFPKPLFLACITAFGAQVNAQGIAPQAQGNVSYVSGGVGQDEVCQIKAMQDSYNLHLLFAETPSNQFLADIPVRIVDRDGNTVLDTRTEGPYLQGNRIKQGVDETTVSGGKRHR